jgi:Restriction endonuclease S subunits
MNPDVFFENFELLADAPNGVQKLRELILQLAVMGKLVPQDPNDESASVLIEKIRADKKRKGKEKKIKGSNSLPISEDEIIFKIPERWDFDRLGNIAQTITKGSTPTSYGYQFQEEGIRFIKVENIKNGHIVIESIKDFISEEAHEFQSRSKLESGDILFSIAGTIGETCVVQDQDLPANTNQALAIIRGTNVVFESYYLKVQFDSFVSNAVKSKARGGAMNNISLGDLKDLIVFIPPLAEQKRIVFKVDELMALCDKLEVRRQKKQEIQSKLNSAALDRMLSTETQDEFEQHWQHICENFDLLYDNPENVEKLRQAILQLAVQGKLVPQNPEDEPASVLIEKVKIGNSKLKMENKVKKRKQLKPMNNSEMSCELPKGWEWVRFPYIGEFGRGKSKHRPRNDPILFENGKYPLVQTGDVAKANGVIKTYTNLYNETGLAQSRIWPKGTLCITIAANIADSAILGFDACFPDSVVGFIPSPEIGSTKYFEYFVRTIKENLEHFAPSTAQKNINLGILENVLIPLPPKKELKRIVEKVEQLMCLCDELESKLRKEQEDSEKLMEAVVKGLLEGENTEKTELEKPIPLQVATIKLK